MSLSRSRVIRLLAAVPAGTSDQDSDGVDMAAGLDTSNYEGVLFVTSLGASGASGELAHVQIEQSADDDSGDDYTALAGSGITVDEDDAGKLVVHDIHRPRKKYLRVHIGRTASIAVDGVVAILYGGRPEVPSDDADTVAAAEVLALDPFRALYRKALVSPPEGSA